MYSNQYGTDGFVPDEALATEVLPCPITKAKAKALADKLCLARVHVNGSALFTRDAARNGYIVHDFLDWNPSKADLDAKRKRDRERKGIRPDAQPDSKTFPRGIQTEGAEESASPPRAPAGESRPPAQPSPPANNHGGGSGLVSCPADLSLTEPQIGTLETSLIPRWAIPILTGRFIANHQANPDDKRDLIVWRKCLSQAISGWWNNSKTRPKKPENDANAETIQWRD